MATSTRSTRSKSRRAAAARRQDYVVDVMTQLRVAVGNPGATAVGALVGGLVPYFARVVAHHEVSTQWWSDPKSLIVLGCMLFSVSTVFTFGRSCFRNVRKAAGFVIAVEGVAVLCSTPSVWAPALALLVLVNAVTSGCTIALAEAETTTRRAAAARGAAKRRGAQGAESTPATAPAPAATAPAATAPRRTPTTAARPASASHDMTDDAEIVGWTAAPRRAPALRTAN